MPPAGILAAVALRLRCGCMRLRVGPEASMGMYMTGVTELVFGRLHNVLLCMAHMGWDGPKRALCLTV